MYKFKFPNYAVFSTKTISNNYYASFYQQYATWLIHYTQGDIQKITLLFDQPSGLQAASAVSLFNRQASWVQFCVCLLLYRALNQHLYILVYRVYILLNRMYSLFLGLDLNSVHPDFESGAPPTGVFGFLDFQAIRLHFGHFTASAEMQVSC